MMFHGVAYNQVLHIHVHDKWMHGHSVLLIVPSIVAGIH